MAGVTSTGLLFLRRYIKISQVANAVIAKMTSNQHHRGKPELAAEAVAWVFKHIAEYGGDPRKIVVSGHSAGGYISMMLCLDKHWLAAYDTDADSVMMYVPFSGQAITHFNVRKMQGIPPLQATIDEYAPLYWVRGDCPPMVLICGDRELELFGRYDENQYLARMMKLAGHQ